MNIRLSLATTVIVLLAVAVPLSAASESFNGHQVGAQQVLLKIRNPSSTILQQLQQLGDADDLRALNRAVGLYLLHSRSANVARLIAAFQNLPFITFVEPDYVVKTTVTPNDLYFPQQWSLLNTGTLGADISATNAWNISTGSTANVVGVIDTGIDYTHPDLAANVWSAPAQFSVNLSWGQLTCPAGSHGYNAISRTCNPADDHGHGTHVSGTIGAIGNNSIGVAGVNWTTRIMGIKFLDSTGSGNISDAIDGMEFAIQAAAHFSGGGTPVNVRVFSASWGGDGFSQALLDEINNANTNEILFVAAAGNSASNNDTTPFYPAAYSAPNLIAVAATGSTDALASFSNWGRTTVHLGAPGVNILSTVPGSAYAYMSGTSMATPHVSGAAMLVLSKCSLNTAALKNALLANVDLIPSLTGLTVTGGRLNVFKALQSCTPALPPTGAATFLKTDSSTQGTWKGTYGADGYNVINDSISYPAYVNATPAGGFFSYTWAASTTDPRAMQRASINDRIAACWFSASPFEVDLSFKDANTHQVALYLLDWDNNNGGRTERIDVLDANNTLLDTRTVSSFVGGQFVVWNLSGHVIVRITNMSTLSNSVLSGILFGPGSGSSSGTAAFVKTDSTTQGTWKGAYGADGYNVINDSISYPAYVNVTPAGGFFSYTWAASTTDPRAMQRASINDRIAACWYSSSPITVDLSFKDANTHQVALYLLDWDNNNGGRTERIDILDANNNVLDTRTVSSFVGGQYVVWNLSGHVIVRITNMSSLSNSVLSGILFGPGGGSASGTAAFVKTDSTTQGTWKGAYGADGYNVINDSTSYPAYVNVTPAGSFFSYTWAASTTDPRAMQRASINDRIAACWYSSSPITVDLSFNDANTHQVALYLLDWDNNNGGRTERIDILDANNNVLDTRTVSSFVGGQYVVWNLSGHVIVRITNMSTLSNSVISGILFGSAGPPASGTAAFVKLDSTTQGTWKGVYGADGYNVINDSISYPAYVNVTPAGGFFSYTWAASGTDPRAMQRASINDRIAACWYSANPITVDLSFNDANTHQVALYLLDWDNNNGGRTERIDILDANNNVLDTRTASSFVGGQYVVWNLSGHVIVRITNMTTLSNSVLSGILFR